MSNILQELEQEIANVTAGVAKTNVGTVREIGDGVAKVEGLSEAQLNEMIEFPGNLFGLGLVLYAGDGGVDVRVHQAEDHGRLQCFVAVRLGYCIPEGGQGCNDRHSGHAEVRGGRPSRGAH